MLKLNRRNYLISGTVLFLLGIVFAFPVDKLMNSGSLIRFAATCSFLGIGLLTLLYGIMGKRAIKAILLVILSTFLGYISWYYYTGAGWLSSTIAFWTGVPIGILSALLYLILDRYFLSKRQQKIILLKQIALYLVLFLTLSLLAAKGSDWIYHIFKK